MSIKKAITTLGIGTISGVAGLLVMDPLTTRIQEMTPESAKEQEKRVQQKRAMKVAAEKIADAVGIQLSDKQAETGGTLFHYGMGILGGMVYLLLCRTLPAHPMVTGLITGLGMFAFLDEGLNAALGFSAPPTAFPKETHARGLIGHLAFGVGVAIAAETLRGVRNKLQN